MLTAKQETFKNGIIAGLSDIDAARAAYPDCKNNNVLSGLANQNLRLPKIKGAIDEHRAKLREKVEMSRELLVTNMQNIVDDAASTRTEKTRAASLIADMCGFKREAAPNQEKEQALAARMSDEEKELARDNAAFRTWQEARKGLKLAGAG